ncbi:MAG: hypothetical protein ABIA74_03520 [bacterium]
MNFLRKLSSLFFLLFFLNLSVCFCGDYDKLYKASKYERAKKYWEIHGDKKKDKLKPAGSTEPIYSVKQQEEMSLQAKKVSSVSLKKQKTVESSEQIKPAAKTFEKKKFKN